MAIAEKSVEAAYLNFSNIFPKVTARCITKVSGIFSAVTIEDTSIHFFLIFKVNAPKFSSFQFMFYIVPKMVFE